MIKDICVHLDGTREDEARLSTAEQLAAMFDAFLAGIYINPLPEMPASLGYGFSGIETEALQKEARAHGQSVAKALGERFDAMGVRTELRSQNVFEGSMRDVLVQESRLFDLCVATRPYGYETTDTWSVESVLFGSGRASLLIPPGGVARFDPATVLVAWRNTREAVRAVSEAMPFLKRAENVSICIVGNDDMSGVERAAQGSDIARHLDRHGVKVQLNPVPQGRGVSETLLEEAKLAGAELIVMGAYGHSRLRHG